MLQLLHGFEQLVCALEQVHARLMGRLRGVHRVAGFKVPVAMLAHDLAT